MIFRKSKIIALAVVLLSCQADTDVLQTIFTFPEELKEISAVETLPKSDLVWTLEDSGNAPELYALNLKGDIINTLKITNATNIDWEELTCDNEGNLYIGDFGNNHNTRKDLCIYKVDASQLKNEQATASQKIEFYFPQQHEFPPKESEKQYDIESFFLYNGVFYLFTKNRSSEFDGTTLMYGIPNIAGNHAAKLMGSFKSCGDFRNCAITSADISPDGKKIVLLSCSHAWIFSDFKKDEFLKGKVQQVDFANFSQKEGICFIDNHRLYVCDERKKKNGGKLYLLDLKALKAKP